MKKFILIASFFMATTSMATNSQVFNACTGCPDYVGAGGGTPGGTGTQIQYKNGSSFAGIPGSSVTATGPMIDSATINNLNLPSSFGIGYGTTKCIPYLSSSNGKSILCDDSLTANSDNSTYATLALGGHSYNGGPGFVITQGAGGGYTNVFSADRVNQPASYFTFYYGSTQESYFGLENRGADWGFYDKNSNPILLMDNSGSRVSTFTALAITGLTASQFVKTDVSKNLTSYDLLNATQTWTGGNTFSSTIQVSSNTILSGTTFYQDGTAYIGPATYTGNISFSRTNNYGVVGSTWASDSCTGCVGEWVHSDGNGIAAGGNSAWATLLTISLTAGDWDVMGSGMVSPVASGPGDDVIYVGVTSDSSDGVYGYSSFYFPGTTHWTSGQTPAVRIKLNTTTTIYLRGIVTYGSGSETWDASISARRKR